MRRTLRAVLLVPALLVLVPSGVRADDDRLTVTQDESSMEATIARYLKARYDVDADVKQLAEGDQALAVNVSAKDAPDVRVVVDTQSSARTPDGSTITERTVTMMVYTGVKVPAAKRCAVLEAINHLVAGNWFSAAYLDEDDEVTLQWSVNVMKEGLPTDYVADAVIRTAQNWRKLKPEVEAALGSGG